MGMVKTLTRAEGVRRFLCWLAAQYIRLVHVTGRWQVVGGELPQSFWDDGRPFILAFWHGRILMMPYCWRRRQPINMLISQHRDGQIIARTVSHFGISTIVGSSSKGGVAALRAMLQSLKGGTCVGITPDGPRGPRMRASDGIVQVARMSGCPIIPCTFSARRRKLLGSWDRFSVALPFSSGVFVWGTSIEVPSGASSTDLQAARDAVEASLNAITEEADRRMGHPPVEPAPRPEASPRSPGGLGR
ncbi:lysophospholipid acyltransferase family protein [Telmatospirillum siberiense]|uniref:DUF374 domain-containing protein n=1 Tax=Telmatospirillum siberiense TaxID=382514 RepID=A0A2N3PNQ1_9PROT|nr:lysophospholipid acyltransferase family protein [Telmatospirillum siberiense]PKU22043.1 hypothetical protein CWS72_23850 [Telmatospirillum siberiense]